MSGHLYLNVDPKICLKAKFLMAPSPQRPGNVQLKLTLGQKGLDSRMMFKEPQNANPIEL